MNNLYYITDNGNGAYVEGYEGDNIYKSDTCILVPKKPTNGGYIYDKQQSKWKMTRESQQNYIRIFRNPELARTDKYVLTDYPLTSEEKEEVLRYRQQLREIPNKTTPEEMIMPGCPSYIDTNL